MHVVFELSDGYDYLVKQELIKSDYKVWQMQPRHIRAFITSESIKAKPIR